MPEATPEQIHRDRVIHQNPYRHVNMEGGFHALAPEKNAVVDIPLQLDTAELRGGKPLDAEFSMEEIEEIVRRFQNNLWKHQGEIWEADTVDDPVDVLDPTVALETLGYVCEKADSLGQFSDSGEKVKIAAVIEDRKKRVRVSGDFPIDVLRFTASHELGHALLHQSEGLHRDRPINKAQSVSARDRREVEADKFATFFLMPKKRVKKHFIIRFDREKLHLDQDTAYGLKPGSGEDLLSRSDSLRGFARTVASAERFHDDHFRSLAERFGVSIEAMAIRLEELDLVSI